MSPLRCAPEEDAMPTHSIVKKEAGQPSNNVATAWSAAAAVPIDNDETAGRQADGDCAGTSTVIPTAYSPVAPARMSTSSVIKKEAGQPPSDDLAGFQEADRGSDDAKHDNLSTPSIIKKEASQPPSNNLAGFQEDDPSDEDFNPDELRAGARVVVLDDHDKPWQATIRGCRAKNGAPGFMIHYDGKSRRKLDWVPRESVVNYIYAGQAMEAQGSSQNFGGRKRGHNQGKGKKRGSNNSRGVAKDEGAMTLDEKWERRFRELVVFRDEEGHCNVPYNNSKYKTLSNWVHRQRQSYNGNGNGGTLLSNRVARLESIGFAWSMNQDEKWERRFRELVVFRDREGHCNIPARSTTLGNWVHSQRTAYRRNGRTLLFNRVARLESIGFQWKIAQREGGEKEETSNNNGSVARKERQIFTLDRKLDPSGACAHNYAALAPSPLESSVAAAVLNLEVREEAMSEIMSGSTSRGEELQAIVDGLSCDTKDVQLQLANKLLHKQGKNAEQRMEGLIIFEKNRRVSRNK